MYYEMVSNTCIPPLAEVFNTYGEGLTNAQLLSQYGFILDMNDNDRVSWTATEVVHILAPRQCTDLDLEEFLTHLRQAVPFIPTDHVLFEDSQLVYFNPLMIDEFCLNSEGKISHHLWILLLLVACRTVRPCLLADFGAKLRLLLDLQVELECLASADDDDDDEVGTDGFDPELLGLLHEMSSSIATLCFERRRASGKAGVSNIDLFELLDVSDETPSDLGVLIRLLLLDSSGEPTSDAACTADFDRGEIDFGWV
jgi:SET domain-containing protein 6